MKAMGAYTTRNAPAPENGDEIVAGPIEGPITSNNTSCTTSKILLAYAARHARLSYYKYIVSIIK
jgi:hypothetical protein